MQAEEFAAWLAGRGLTHSAAAPILAADQPEVTRWANGTRPVPRRIVRIVELLEAQAPMVTAEEEEHESG